MSIFIAVDTIHRAIAANRQIQFKYYDYTIHKERKYFRKGAFYIASPFALIYSDDNYCLLACESGKFKRFRVDKMERVKLLELIDREGREGFEKLDMAAYSKYTFNMYDGKQQCVRLFLASAQIALTNEICSCQGRDRSAANDPNRFRPLSTG